MASIVQGSIVWARMNDPRGSNSKFRPGVVLNADVIPGAPLTVAAITTAFTEPLAGNLVELPCDHTTGLTRRSAVVCDWLAQVRETDIDSVAGTVPPTLMLAIIRRLPKFRPA